MINRRSAIAVLGIVPAASGAAIIEALGAASQPMDCKTGDNSTVGFAIPKPKTIAAALRAFANELEEERAFIQWSSLVTSISPEDFVEHEFSIRFCLVRPPQPEDVMS